MKKAVKFFCLIAAPLFAAAFFPHENVNAAFLTYELKREYLYDEIGNVTWEEYSDLTGKIDATVAKFERLISPEQEGSDVYRINRAQAGQAVKVDDMTMDLLLKAEEMYEFTGGAFNPAVYNLVKLWGFSPDNEGKYSVSRKEPEQKDIDECKKYLNFASVTLDSENMTVTKPDSQMQIDLGGIAKGYLSDLIADMLKSSCTDAFLTLMSNTYALGENKAENRSFRVAITDPRKINEQCFFVDVTNKSVVTSGDYERYYYYGGKRYCHIIDPITGKPADNGIISVTVVGESGARGDAIATACFGLKPKAAVNLIEKANCSAIIVTSDYNFYFVGDADFKVTAEEITGYPQSRYTRKSISEMPDTVIAHEDEYVRTSPLKIAVYVVIIGVTVAVIAIIVAGKSFRRKNESARKSRID